MVYVSIEYRIEECSRGDGWLLQRWKNVVRNEESRSRLLESSDIVHKKHVGKVS